MTPPPISRASPTGREPECPRLRTVERPRDSHAFIVLAFTIYLLPFLGGASGSIVFAREAIGPLITLLAWVAFLIATIARSQRVSWIECLPVIGGLVVLQLLLDLHTPYLGDIVIAALHALLLLIALVSQISSKRAR